MQQFLILIFCKIDRDFDLKKYFTFNTETTEPLNDFL